MISVLLPVYNTKPEFLDACLSSIHSQTYKPHEIVVVDNGSDKPSTLAYLKSCKNIDLHVIPRKANHKNLSIALNAGLNICKYDYVARMDSDDIMHAERLDKQYKYFCNNPYVDILGCQLRFMSSHHGQTQHPLIVEQNIYKKCTFFLNHPCVMYKRRRILDLQGYQTYPDCIPEDFLLWVKALKKGFVIHNLPEVLLDYRDNTVGLYHSDSKTYNWNYHLLSAINS